jgi:hypothetical protein
MSEFIIDKLLLAELSEKEILDLEAEVKARRAEKAKMPQKVYEVYQLDQRMSEDHRFYDLARGFSFECNVIDFVTLALSGNVNRVGEVKAVDPEGVFEASNHPDRERFEKQITRYKLADGSHRFCSVSVGDLIVHRERNGEDWVVTEACFVMDSGWLNLEGCVLSLLSYVFEQGCCLY